METQTGIDKYMGQVKFFNKDRGFGFITVKPDTESPTDYFVHHTAIQPKTNCWNVLYKGEYVEFEIKEGQRGPQASVVTGLCNGTLMCDNEFEYRRRRAQKRNNEQAETTVEQGEVVVTEVGPVVGANE